MAASSRPANGTQYRIVRADTRTAPVLPAAWTATAATAKAARSPHQTTQKFGGSAETGPRVPNSIRAIHSPAFAPLVSPDPRDRLRCRSLALAELSNSALRMDASWNPRAPLAP